MATGSGPAAAPPVGLAALHRYAPNLSLLFTDVPLLERPAAAAAAGFRDVELWWPFAAAVPPATTVSVFADEVERAGVSVASLNLYSGNRAAGDRGLLSDADRSPLLRRNAAMALELVEQLACPVLHAPFGNRLPGTDWPRQHRHAVTLLSELARAAASVGTTVVVEAQCPVASPSYPLRTTKDAIAVAQAASDLAGVRVAITFDAYHMQQTEGELSATVASHLEHIAHVQVADVPGRGPPGTGSAPLGPFLRTLAALGYRGAVGLEYHSSGDRAADLAWLVEPLGAVED